MGQTNSTWISTITGNVIVEAWGSGAGGYGSSFGGGGAGAYARTAGIPVVISVGYNVAVGNAGLPNLPGDDSTFNSSSPNAKGGQPSNLGAGGLGGTAAASTGDVRYSGGDGSTSTVLVGGGGGSSGGDEGSGNVGAQIAGGFAVHRGGAGGDGAFDTVAPGIAGLSPGGGGGASVGPSPGGGGDGAVVIWEDLGVWPPIGQAPLATYGTPPPNTYYYGDFSYIPPVNQTVIAECWGSGGGGRIGQGGTVPGCGGGSGAYARKAGIALTAGVAYLVRVGGPYNVPANHESLFVNGGVVLADFGTSAPFQGPGSGGLASSSVGDVKFSGANGAPYPGDGPHDGGGGASSAGRASDGNIGGFPAAGATVLGGGPGGIGGTAPDGDGTAPSIGPGGGGGGGSTGSVQTNPGGGFEGAVVIWLDGGVWPPVGSPVASFGAPPPLPTPPTPGAKYRKTATCM